MSKWYLTILFFVLIGIGISTCWADDYIDDVYYTPSLFSNHPVDASSNQQFVSIESDHDVLQERIEEDGDQVKVIFIEDEETLQSDTIVKVIIRR